MKAAWTKNKCVARSHLLREHPWEAHDFSYVQEGHDFSRVREGHDFSRAVSHRWYIRALALESSLLPMLDLGRFSVALILGGIPAALAAGEDGPASYFTMLPPRSATPAQSVPDRSQP